MQAEPSRLLADDFNRRLQAAEQAIGSRSAETVAPEVQQKVSTLEQRLARIDEIEARLNQLADANSKIANETRSLEQRVQPPEATKELAERVARLDQAMASLRAAGNDPQAGRVAQLAAINGKLTDLESALSNQVAALRKNVTQELDARLGPVAEASEAAKSGTQRVDREQADLKTEVARLAQRADALKAADDTAQQGIRALQDDTAGIKTAIDGLKADTAAQLKAVTRPQDVAASLAPISNQIAALEQIVQGIAKGEEDRKATAERIVLALELGNLKRAIDRGGNYTAELSNAKSVASDQIDLSALDRYKDKGLATQADLAREFRTVANSIIDADTTPADMSALDRLLQGAKSIVRVRRTDHRPEDTGAEATVARMEKALNAGNLDEVLTEASQLSPKARNAADAWLTRLEARATVDRALAKIEDQLKAMVSSKPAEKRT
jgi:hypothetical protein